MFRTAALVLSMFLALPAAHARQGTAPPETVCSAPAGPLREVICASPALRDADRELRVLERRLGSTTPRAATMAVRAGTWRRMIEAGEALSTPRPFTPDELLDEYRARQEVLRELLRQDAAMRRLEQPQAVLARPPGLEQRCLGNALRDCRVTATGMSPSEGHAPRILWQAQRGFTEADGVRAGIVLLAEARGGWRLLGWAFEGASYAAPTLSAQDGGPLLVVPGRRGGSGAGNADLLYQLRRGTWHEVETEGWQEGAAARLPPGLDIRRGVAHDFDDMTARTPLWRDGDADCCPTGGGARLDFRIVGNALVLDAVAPDAVEDSAALLARAPAIALDGEFTGLAGPVSLGGAGWGPFRRLCVATFIRRPDGGDTPLAEPSCFDVETAREEGGTWHLALRTDPLRGGPAVAFNTTRDGEGVVGPVELVLPAGVPAPSAEMRTRVENLFRLALHTHGLRATTIMPATPFVMPLPVGAVDSDLRVAEGGFTCRPEGTAARQGRPVLVAICTAVAERDIAPGQSMKMNMAGRFVLDVATGMVLQHGYAAFLVIEPDPRGSTRRSEMRTLSRQSLE